MHLLRQRFVLARNAPGTHVNRFTNTQSRV
jgi:hypothetical protein